MIIIHCKQYLYIINNIEYPIIRNNIIKHNKKSNQYIKSIEYIDNKIDEVLIKEYHKNINIYINLKVQIHNPVGPAWQEFYDNKIIKKEEYYKNGNHHREDGPAIIYYDENRKIINESYYINGEYIFSNDFEKS